MVNTSSANFPCTSCHRTYIYTRHKSTKNNSNIQEKRKKHRGACEPNLTRGLSPCDLIAQISTGEGFGGLVNYANDIAKKDTVIIASEGVNLSSNVTITASFKAQAKARPTLHKFVGHISLSFSPEDLAKLDDKKIAEIAQEYNLTGGLSPCEQRR